MIAEVIAIGDELTSGQRLDTNSQWLSQRLGDLGIRVLYHSTVGDDLPANVAVFQTAHARADVVIATGGLGPTADDLTRQALAEAANVELELDSTSLERIEQMFSSRGRTMPERNRVQAMFPKGSEAIPNPHGTAPGILQVTRGDGHECRTFALPGVPAEMREMWDQSVEPELIKLLGPQRRIIQHHCVKCFGVGESDLEQMLPDMIRRGRQPTVGITVSKATITLRVSAEADSPAGCEDLIRPTVQTIHECLNELVFGEQDDELQHAVVRQLEEQGKSLATVEWDTGGIVADWFTEADPRATSYRGGMVLRTQDAISALTGTPNEGDSAVADLVATAARSTRERFGADLGLAIGPFPEMTGTESDRICFALATDDERVVGTSARFAGHPDILKARGAKQAINLLRLHLRKSG